MWDESDEAYRVAVLRARELTELHDRARQRFMGIKNGRPQSALDEKPKRAIEKAMAGMRTPKGFMMTYDQLFELQNLLQMYVVLLEDQGLESAVMFAKGVKLWVENDLAALKKQAGK